MRKLILFFSVSCMLMASCEDDDSTVQNSSIDFGYQYIPLTIGQENIYSVDSIIYNDFTGGIDSLSFQRRERIDSTFTDNENRLAYKVAVSIRLNDTSVWVQQKVVSKQLTEIRFELLDNNIRTVPLVFPISEGKRWNVNALNTEVEQIYEYKNVHLFYQLNDSTSFDSTITIAQREEKDLIQRFFAEEVYAAQIGLVYRKDIQLKTELNGDIKSGFEATIKLISSNAN